jgi:hypothetical protein
MKKHLVLTSARAFGRQCPPPNVDLRPLEDRMQAQPEGLQWSIPLSETVYLCLNSDP